MARDTASISPIRQSKRIQLRSEKKKDEMIEKAVRKIRLSEMIWRDALIHCGITQDDLLIRANGQLPQSIAAAIKYNLTPAQEAALSKWASKKRGYGADSAIDTLTRNLNERIHCLFYRERKVKNNQDAISSNQTTSNIDKALIYVKALARTKKRIDFYIAKASRSRSSSSSICQYYIKTFPIYRRRF